MKNKVSRRVMRDVIAVMGQRYREANKPEKTRILNQLVSMAGCHRKHAVRLLRQGGVESRETRARGRIYDEAVKDALIILWEAGDRICSRRLKALLPSLMGAMEQHGHLALDGGVRERLLTVSAATIDRLLAPIRGQAQRRKKRRKKTRASEQVAVRTFADWDGVLPGHLEIDLVAHNGGSMAGIFIHSLVVTDVTSSWTEAVPLLAREQSLVAEGLEVIGRQLPVPVLGIDSDNDSAFINDTLLSYCKQRGIEFTRSRAYHKNDQAWIEQKNGSVVRRFVGYERLSGVVAGQALAQLYQTVRLYVNYFQPSFKLREKHREGAKVKKEYYQPRTPCDRLLDHPEVAERSKEALRAERARLDPVELLHRIREAQAALAALSSSDKLSEGPGRESLDQFLAQLPRLWRDGEVRPTHRKEAPTPRTWRTRKDPFESVWSQVLLWLQDSPDATAKSLFERLSEEHPERYTAGQLRTLQRRIREWRQVMARKLVYACMQGEENAAEIVPVGADRSPQVMMAPEN